MRPIPGQRLSLLVISIVLMLGCGDRPETGRALDTRAVVIGIDGADWRIIDRLVAEGDLPNLQRLRERGVWGPIATLEDIPLSPVIWTSMATGKSAKKHGITWFMVDREDGTRVPVRSHNRRVKAIWNLLAERGESSTIVGWWATYPAEEVGEGVIVSDGIGFHGFGTTARRDEDAGKTWPSSLLDEIAPLMPPVESIPYEFAQRFLALSKAEYAAESFHPNPSIQANSPDPKNPIHLFQQYAATAAGYTAIFEHLLDRPDALQMVYFEQVDSFSHLFMKYAPPRLEWVDEQAFARYSEMVFEWYRYQDELLGRLLAKIDLNTTAVFVVSDHGFKTDERRIKSAKTIDARRAHLDHERHGIFLAAGPHIRRGGEIRGASVLDLTPTLLHYLGLPVGRDMDGKILDRVFIDGFGLAEEERFVPTWEDASSAPSPQTADFEELTDEELTATREALSTLGYLGGSDPGFGPPVDASSGSGDDLSSPEIHNNLGRIHLRDGELDEARTQFEKALTLDPQNADALLNLASLHRTQGRLAAAEHLVQEALRADPDSILALSELAEMKREQQDLEESIRLYTIALQVDDSQPFLHLGLGDSLNRAGRHAEAEAAFRAALALDPDSFNAFYNLGVTFLERGDLDQAAAEFERALQVDPQHVHVAAAHNNLGDIALRRGDREGAIASFLAAAEASPFHLESRYNLGALHFQSGEYQAAVARFEEAVALSPNHEQSNANLGMAYLFVGRHEDAYRSLLLVQRLYPRNWLAPLGLALLHAGARKDDEARRFLNTALDNGGQAAQAEALRFPLLAPFFNASND